MLSILIPTFNTPCVSLVSNLVRQAEGLDVEIVVAEDGTTDATALAANSAIEGMPQCRYMPFKENRGRAAIRNLLAHEARGERLLFLDDDVMPADEDFLKRYMECDAPVVAGGVMAAKDNRSDSLRWLYDKAAEKHMGAEQRQRAPHRHFSTANFAVKRDLFLGIRFNEDITEYGYEDALFGIELQQRGVTVHHINAAVFHNGLDPNPLFLKKTEQALRTLHSLPQMQPYATIARTARRLHFLSPLIISFAPFFRSLALSRRPQLWAFQAYKLSYYMMLGKGEI
ncbi:MAG: glycosyltransferase family 2 protein [Bacteroidaceae bacterium]|nr:glycosyltransferase family 2 protein [Bacteroidaceae bacterium]